MSHELLDQAARDLGGQQRLARGDRADRAGDLLRRARLEQEAAGARAQRLVDVLVELERGEDQHARAVAAAGQQPARRLEPVDAAACERPSARRPDAADAACSTASRPSPASPTTVMSLSVSTIIRTPPRTTG